MRTRVRDAKMKERGFYFSPSPKISDRGSAPEKDHVGDMVNAYVDIICEDFKNIGKW